MRNSTVLIIAGASAATAAAIPVRASNAVTTEAPITAPQAAQAAQAVQTPGKDSEVWYVGTKQSEDAQSTEAVIIETDEEYEHVLKQAIAAPRRKRGAPRRKRGLRQLFCDERYPEKCGCVVM